MCVNLDVPFRTTIIISRLPISFEVTLTLKAVLEVFITLFHRRRIWKGYLLRASTVGVCQCQGLS